MVTIHIWYGLYGHAAIEIAATDQQPARYISFHPQKGGLVPGLNELTVGKRPMCMATYDEDVKHMSVSAKGKANGDGRAHYSLTLSNLNELAIRAILEDFGICGESDHKTYNYQFLRRNCSNAVAICLAAGTFQGNLASLDKRFIKKQLKRFRKEIQDVEVREIGRAVRTIYSGKYVSEDLKPRGRKATLAGVGAAATAGLTGGAAALMGFTGVGAVLLLGSMALGYPMMAADSLQYDFLKWDPYWIHNLVIHLQPN